MIYDLLICIAASLVLRVCIEDNFAYLAACILAGFLLGVTKVFLDGKNE